VTTLVAFFGLVALLSLVGFLVGWQLDVASEEGKGIDATITYLLIVTGLIMLGGHAVLCWFLWQSGKGDAPAYKRPSARTEWKWAVIPVVLMIALSEGGVLLVSGPVWDSLYVEQPKDPVVVEIVGRQFEWLMRYPGTKDGEFGRTSPKLIDSENPIGIDEDDDNSLDDIWKRGQLVVPVGRPVVLRMHTQDVIHSFFVPHFRVKQDLIPGFQTRLKFTPTRTGTFELACTELCGLGHYRMRGEVKVVEPDEYEDWLSKQFTFGG
jgi:cytochrome c oxidase subunit 2